MIADLPDDPKVLKDFIESMMEQLAELARDNDRLRQQLERLRRSLFGRKTEKVDVRQFLLFMDQALAELGQAGAPGEGAGEGQAEPPASRDDKRTGHGRNQLPAHLPRRRREIPPRPEDLVCDCCKRERRKIGEDVSLRLDYQPGTFTVIEEVRPKFACPDCPKSVTSPPPPLRPIPKGLAEPGLLAHVLVSKFADHLPLDRQSKILQRSGIHLSPNTLGDWVAACADLLVPLHDVLRREVLAASILNTDDTPIRVLEPNGPGVHRGHLWVYVAPVEARCTVFDFSPTWEGKHPQAFLASYEGKLQADGYAGYEPLFQSGRIIKVACGMHIRRKFFDARKSAPAGAHMALGYFRALFRIEKSCRGKTPEERRAARQQQAKPVLKKFEEWLDAQEKVVPPRSPLGEAIGYAKNQWKAFLQYLEDGRLEIDNRAAEQAVRGVACGRKNWMFAGSDQGGRRTAIMLSFIETCRQQGVEPFAYVRDVLARLPTHPADRLEELTPRAWKAARQQAVPGVDTS